MTVEASGTALGRNDRSRMGTDTDGIERRYPAIPSISVSEIDSLCFPGGERYRIPEER